MRFNEKHTCLELLEGKIPTIYINKKEWGQVRKDSANSDIKKALSNEKLVSNFGSKVQYMTEPFYRAYEKVQKKMVSILEKEPLGLTTGTMIVRADTGIVKTIFYYIDQDDLNQFNLIMLSFTKGYGLIALDYLIQYIPVIGTKDEMDIQFLLGDPYSNLGVTHNMIVVDFMLQLLFIKYCDIENKIVKPKEKYKKDGVKYLNETKSNIEILDSRWFTNIVREDPFLVSGHLRKQPYPSLGTWRWKYIKEYQKEGYNLKAKKTKNGD